jgi:hypothetical protein
MPGEAEAAKPPAGPDWVFLSAAQMPDRGPRYAETPPDPYAPSAPFLAEPWNALSASVFVVIALVWAWRLRGRFRDYPFLAWCLPILFAGGVGGTLYHATRTSVVFFLLDVIPISLLGLAGAVFMALRYWGKRGWWFAPGGLAFFLAVNSVLFAAVGPADEQVSINLSYAALAAVILLPMLLVLARTRFRHAGWVVSGVIAFAIAWFFRLVDLRIGPYLAMGSHWLWHLFGAAATACLIEYFYRVEGEGRQRAAR